MLTYEEALILAKEWCLDSMGWTVGEVKSVAPFCICYYNDSEFVMNRKGEMRRFQYGNPIIPVSIQNTKYLASCRCRVPVQLQATNTSYPKHVLL